ncbi:MAG: hypothetical protein LBC45_00620 [Chlamydiales bacterium]|jgi:hypothetical protein|nr:hypothetical protein [Chlamydiales bacterium]
MPLGNVDKLNLRANQSTPRENSISSVPEDQRKALVCNLTNATVYTPPLQSSLVVERNLQGLQERLIPSLSREISFKLYDSDQVNYQEIDLRIKAPEVSSDLPIFFREDITDTMSLSEPLPFILQESKGCTAILDLLKTNFPELTSSPFFNRETKIPRFVVSSPIPLNQEDKGNFFPQIKSEGGKIAYIAWDSSGSQVAKGFREKICDILLDDQEAFCGVALSQDHLKEIEERAGASAYFMTSKVTIIGILIEPSEFMQSSWFRMACEGSSDDDDLRCDEVIARGSFSGKNRTPFGMLGVQGTGVYSHLRNLPDRQKKQGETLYPFCLEIVPQFSSEEAPVYKENLEMAIEMQFQKKIYEQFKE